MPGSVATLLFALGILGLFALNRNAKVRPSPALWIPVIWIGIAGSRTLSQWFAALHSGIIEHYTADQLLDGNPFDRAFLLALLLMGVVALILRGRKVWTLLRSNAPLVLFFLYCGISTLWSDYTDVSFKRWIKACGDLTMVLIVLTDVNPSAAVKVLLARVGFLLVPGSILVSKYYSTLGRCLERAERRYTPELRPARMNWEELPSFWAGSGLATLRILSRKEEPKTAGRSDRSGCAARHGHVAVLERTDDDCAVLFPDGESTTCRDVFSGIHAKDWVIHVLVVGMLLVSVSALFLGVGSGLLTTMGKDATLTGRTAVWDLVLSLTKNPMIGTGFESFWLGPRLDKIWSVYWWHPNEAHNGYIEVYLNLGWIGVSLLAVLMVSGYRTTISALRRDPDSAGFGWHSFWWRSPTTSQNPRFASCTPSGFVSLLATITVPGGWLGCAHRSRSRLSASRRIVAVSGGSLRPFDENGMFRLAAEGGGIRQLAVRGAVSRCSPAVWASPSRWPLRSCWPGC